MYDFVWSELCDWYIELVKPRLYGDNEGDRAAAQATLLEVLEDSLKLLHPIMPFITEEIYSHINEGDGFIAQSKWPEYNQNRVFGKDENELQIIIDAIRSIRNIRTEMNVPNSRKAKIMIVPSTESARAAFEDGAVYLEKLASASEVVFPRREDISKDAVSSVIPGGEIFMPLDDLIDRAKELERLNKEKERLEKEVERVAKKLSNQGFISKAPESVVNEEKEKQNKYQEMLYKVIERINTMK